MSLLPILPRCGPASRRHSPRQRKHARWPGRHRRWPRRSLPPGNRFLSFKQPQGSLLVLTRKQRTEQLLGGLRKNAALVPVDLQQGGGELLGLLQADMRRQGWDIRIGANFQQHRTLRSQSLFPGWADILFTLDQQAEQANGVGEGVVG